MQIRDKNMFWIKPFLSGLKYHEEQICTRLSRAAGRVRWSVMKVLGKGFTTAAFAVSGILVVVGASGIGSSGAETTVSLDIPVDFNRDVRPILSEHCYPCHGPDKAATAKTGGLRLDSFEEATKDLGDYFAIAPGDLEESFLVERIDAEDDDFRMPPVGSSVKPLTPEQRQTLKAWISQGARYDRHWAFVPPETPELPKVENWGWVRNPIDRFVLTGMAEKGFKPAAEADKATLLRRATLALTGLPPSIEQIDAFLADTDQGAYERMIEELLDSPAYGENQARFWMDAVRYGDTHGLHLDNERSIWPFRDWVVRAFNEDLPYDDFTTWQLAGDMLEEPTLDQKIASGYIRMHPTTNEGGVIAAEFQAKNTFDRVETTGMVFMGMTVMCARCHDHRFDPITQEEYFGLFAFFNSTVEGPLDGNALLPAPVIKVPSPEQSEAMTRYRKKQFELEAAVDLADVRAWIDEAELAPIAMGEWQKSQVYSAENFDYAHTTEFGPEKGVDDVKWADTKVELGKGIATVVGKENSAVYFKTVVESPRIQQIELRLGSDDGIRVWRNKELIHDNKVARGLVADSDKVPVSLVKGSNELIFKVVNGGGQDGFYVATGDKRRSAIENSQTLLKKDTRTDAELLTIKQNFLQHGPEKMQAGADWRTVRKSITDLDKQIPSTLVAEETKEPRPAMFLGRGEYDHPEHEVKRAIPAAMGELPEGAPENRLGLAQWLTSSDNPLAARVFVNRIWQQHFGTGLVKTSENFGSQGEWPSHPELLDWLSREFVDNGWSVKDLHRLIVTSAAYRQNAAANSDEVANDPENRLISHGPRFRLDAEVIRDQALFLSGLLSDKVGGKGVKPYQPIGLWKAVGYTDSNTANFVQDHGDALYRRSLYTFWKRTSPPPTLAAFDAPTREACVVRRSRTNTPLQALATMNDPQFVEASRHFAERAMAGGKTDAERATYAFRMAATRKPNANELKVLLKIFRAEKTKYLANPENALSFLSIGESKRNEALNSADHAAWTVVCSMILNLDEVLTLH
jgi:hypothetical protein